MTLSLRPLRVDSRSTRLLCVRLLLVACAVAGSLAGLPSCGKDTSKRKEGTTGPSSASTDRSSPEVVLAAAHRALSAGDLAALRPYLTDDGLSRLEADLHAWRGALANPVGGPRVASRVRVPEDPAARESVSRALTTDEPSALLHAYVQIEPREPLSPPTAPVPARDPTADRAELSMPAHGGESRLVHFVRGADGWRIDRLQL